MIRGPDQMISEQQANVHIWVDKPAVANGKVAEPVGGRLTIEGWALAKSGVESIEVCLDEQTLGNAYYGMARRDVQEAFPDVPNALRSGFLFSIPPRVLESGRHIIKLRTRTTEGNIKEVGFQVEVKRNPGAEDDYATIRRRISQVEIDLYQDILSRLGWNPSFCFLLRIAGSIDPTKVGVTIASICRQTYQKWHVVIIADEKARNSLRRELPAIEPSSRHRFRVIRGTDLDNPIPSDQVGDGPSLVSFLSPGDELGCDCLAEIAVASGLRRYAKLFYADEDRISPSTRRREPFFKPDWSPDLILSTNYIGRPWFVRSDVLGTLNFVPRELLERGEYDLVLRCTELVKEVRHLPVLLCKRDEADLDAPELEREALAGALARRSIKGDVLQGSVRGIYRVKRTCTPAGRVSIIIPTCAAKGHVKTCVDTLRSITSYSNFEIIAIDNIPAKEISWKSWLRSNVDQVVRTPGAFNWSRFNNRAVDRAGGEYLLFLNDDTEIVQGDWLDALLEHGQRPEVAIVGPKLLYPDRRIQHAGIFLTQLGEARHSFRFADDTEDGYFGLAAAQRNAIAVTGACLLVRRKTFEELGRFDEAHEIVNNDLDFCLRAHAAGLRIIYTPHAEVIHHELASRKSLKDVFDVVRFAGRWGLTYTEGDPFFSPRLTTIHDDHRPDPEAVRAVYAGHPLFRREDVKRILVVKLDHIGDLITALPAIRRLKTHFPTAKLYFLASRAGRSLLASEESIEQFIDFDFFHARSGLGRKELTDEEMDSLRKALLPYQFDLAIDMRKNIDTRDVLLFTGARFLVGYDQLGRFPWLDVAIELEGAPALQRKRNHVSDDLLRLADAVVIACSSDRGVVNPIQKRDKAYLKLLPLDARKLFRERVVAVPSRGWRNHAAMAARALRELD